MITIIIMNYDQTVNNSSNTAIFKGAFRQSTNLNQIRDGNRSFSQKTTTYAAVRHRYSSPISGVTRSQMTSAVPTARRQVHGTSKNRLHAADISRGLASSVACKTL